MVGTEATQGTEVQEKTRLDRETIIEAGLRIAAKPGTTTVTVRELGTMLGTDPTAIYRHFRNKESLMQALLDHLLAIGLSGVTAPREQWRERVLQLANSTLDAFVTYPAIGLEAIVLSTDGPAELDSIEFMLDAVSQSGLTGDDLVRHYASLASYVISYASGIAREHSLSKSVTSDEALPWVGRPLAVTARSHPHIDELRTELTALQDRDIYLLGINALLDAAESAGKLATAP
ncbi:TetR/AcrR family transcriptional regulator [Leifsonia sp. A12D58]|uniref:TetR/AcrR family transcriptional regulator n=1 Tax=Leifsonia sp. A12D58 TaxID=3397674 RepID=UPI0039E06C3F